ncbi:Xaa-Pro peptidase family protein [bacterium]|nr:Xaa-Pro peptidase family protein [bacterium]
MKKVIKQLEERNLDGLFLVDYANIRYMSGFTNADSYILITKEKQYFLTDYRYSEQAEKECKGFEVITVDREEKPLEQVILEIADSTGLKNIGFEENHIVFQLLEKLRGAMPRIEFVPTNGIVESLRYIKTNKEIDYIQTAASIADKAFDQILDTLKPGMTELEAAWKLETFMREFGADSSAFQTILISGQKTSLPHGIPSRKKIEKGDLVTIDFGALVEGYRSDMTRTIVVGKPDEKQKKIYAIIQEAQEQGLQSARAGRTGKEVNEEVMKIISGYGYIEFAGKGLGHGVGLDIHELPFMNKTCGDELKENCVVTIEPGIYIPYWGGVRIEDIIAVKNGPCKVLSNSPKELISI